MRCRMKAEVISLAEEKLNCRILGFERVGRGASAEVYNAAVERTCENKLEIEFLEFI